MPIYAYRCDACGHAHDALQKMSDAPLRDCPACGQSALVKQVTAAGFQLKGSGWYVTDFRNGKGGTGAAATGPVESANSAGSSASTPAAASAAPAAAAPAAPAASSAGPAASS